jgi:hypothetical protein
MTLSPRHGAALQPCRRATVSPGTATAAEDREEQRTTAAAEDWEEQRTTAAAEDRVPPLLPRTGSRRVPLLPKTHGRRRPQLI